MKDHDHAKPGPVGMFPKRLQTYLRLNCALAVFMAIVMAVRAELRTGRYLLIDVGLILVFSIVLASMLVGPLALTELYLYRKKKGIWYDWRNKTPRRAQDQVLSLEEIQVRKSEAYRVRLSGGGENARSELRTKLFQADRQADTVSRAALLMSVAEKLERAGKKDAAKRCYQQIVQRFGHSHQANEAARRLTSSTPA
jgi:hypothetical protein